VEKLFNDSLTIAESGLAARAKARSELRRVNPMVNCLLIDKNPTERQRLSKILSGLGLQCEERSGADEGIRFCHERKPEVVVMEASGVTATKEFLRLVKYQGRTSRRPVVILYAAQPDILAMGDTIMDGAADFLMMPFDSELLQFKLAQAGVLPN
jgi:two-component system, chemotaxis family, chemotaxis protein CheY